MTATNELNASPAPLPVNAFTSVLTNKLQKPIIAWTNDNCFDSRTASDNAFSIRQQYEAPELYTAEERIQYADRYGGRGLGFAGGSGRCAIHGNLQIKGVGVTPLVSPRNELFHTSGTVSLQEAGREVIWSQIFDAFLPYGAVPSSAIVLTGGIFYERSAAGVNISRQRSLVMREFVLRPAHYLRNLLFVEPSERVFQVDGLSQDASRCHAAVNMLHIGFEEAFGQPIIAVTGIEKINLGLQMMVKRFAAQLAASFSKRIFHGALSCSNIALDGRFMDFGVTSFVDAYRRRARGATWIDPWTQHTALIQTIQLLRFQIQKYLQVDDPKSLISESELVAVFLSEIATRHEVELLKMTGVPEDIVLNYSLIDRQRLYQCLRTIYRSGATEAFISWPARAVTVGANPPPRQNGRYDLNKILAVASTCTDRNELDRTLAEALSDTRLRGEFIDNYSNFRRWVTATFDSEAQRAGNTYVALQASRLNADLSFLTLEVLKDQLTLFDSNPLGVGDFINNTIQRATYVVKKNHPDLAGDDAMNQIFTLTRMGSALPAFVRKMASAVSIIPQARDCLNRMFET